MSIELQKVKRRLHENDLNGQDTVEFEVELFADDVIILKLPGLDIWLHDDGHWSYDWHK